MHLNRRVKRRLAAKHYQRKKLYELQSNAR